MVVVLGIEQTAVDDSRVRSKVKLLGKGNIGLIEGVTSSGPGVDWDNESVVRTLVRHEESDIDESTGEEVSLSISAKC